MGVSLLLRVFPSHNRTQLSLAIEIVTCKLSSVTVIANISHFHGGLRLQGCYHKQLTV